MRKWPAMHGSAATAANERLGLLAGDRWLLELFHGPTSAFKDYGARFLAAALSRLNEGAASPLTVLVATSGDTGSAVGAAFHGLPNVRVAILYPDGRVSPRQAHQLGCFGGNVRAFRVAGSFDDCQRMVKASFADAALRADVPLTSANSISLGRLLPQRLDLRLDCPGLIDLRLDLGPALFELLGERRALLRGPSLRGRLHDPARLLRKTLDLLLDRPALSTKTLDSY